MELLGETQITCAFSSLVWSSTVDYTPCELVFSVTVFKCRYEIRQFCLFSFRAVFEGGLVQCISCLESVFCHANVVLFLVLVLSGGLVNYVVL